LAYLRHLIGRLLLNEPHKEALIATVANVVQRPDGTYVLNGGQTKTPPEINLEEVWAGTAFEVPYMGT